MRRFEGWGWGGERKIERRNRRETTRCGSVAVTCGIARVRFKSVVAVDCVFLRRQFELK